MPELNWDTKLMLDSDVDLTKFHKVEINTSKESTSFYESEEFFMKVIELKDCGRNDPKQCLNLGKDNFICKNKKCWKNIKRINEEAKALIKLSDVKNVVNLVDYGIINGGYAIILELYEIVEPKEFYNQLSLVEIIDLFVPLFMAINETADNNIVHRDIKHPNFLFKNGELHITDFGISFDKDIIDRMKITGNKEPLANIYTPVELIIGEDNHGVIGGINFYKLDVINLTRCLFEACTLLDFWNPKLVSIEAGEIFQELKIRHSRISDQLTHDLSILIFNNGFYNGDKKEEKLSNVSSGTEVARLLVEIKNKYNYPHFDTKKLPKDNFHISAETFVKTCIAYYQTHDDMKLTFDREEIDVSQLSFDQNNKIIVLLARNGYGQIEEAPDENENLVFAIKYFNSYFKNDRYQIEMGIKQSNVHKLIKVDFSKQELEKLVVAL